jgi:hypothetical protein
MLSHVALRRSHWLGHSRTRGGVSTHVSFLVQKKKKKKKKIFSVSSLASPGALAWDSIVLSADISLARDGIALTRFSRSPSYFLHILGGTLHVTTGHMGDVLVFSILSLDRDPFSFASDWLPDRVVARHTRFLIHSYAGYSCSRGRSTLSIDAATDSWILFHFNFHAHGHVSMSQSL